MELLQWCMLAILLAHSYVATGERNIIVNPLNATLSRGETVTFACTVTAGTEDVSYVVWEKNENPISNNYDVSPKVNPQRYSIVSGDVGREFNLQITNINSLDSGSYQCVVETNPLNVIASSTTVWLNYKTPPRDEYPECITPAEDAVYEEGEQVSFICRSGLAVPPVKLSWSDQNQVAINTHQRSESNFEVAELPRTLTRADNGKTFQCNLTHELLEGERSCVVGPLDIQYPPSDVTIEYNANELLQGASSISFTCKADANPSVGASDIEWMVPPVIPESKIQKNGPVLILSDVEVSFNGVIVECVARNDRGEAKTSLVIEGITQPTTTPAQKTTTSTVTTTKSTSTVPTTFSDVSSTVQPPTYEQHPTPEAKPNPPTTRSTQDSLLWVEKNFIFAVVIGALFILLCFILLLILVFGKKRGKTIVVVNSEDNLRNLSVSGTSVNGTKLLLGTPVMDRRNRTPSENPSDDSFDSAIHLASPVVGDQPDYRGQTVHRSRSNISGASSESSGMTYIRVPSTELLIDPSSEKRSEPSRYVVLDMVNQNGKPFPSAEQRQVPNVYATTERQRSRQPDNRGFETIPLRSVSRDQHEGLYVLKGGHYLPVQHVSDPITPGGHSPVIITVGDDSNSSDEEVNVQQRIPFLDPKYRPV